MLLLVVPRSKVGNGEVPIVDLDSGETIPTPTPIRSVFPSGYVEEEGGSSHAEGAEAGM